MKSHLLRTSLSAVALLASIGIAAAAGSGAAPTKSGLNLTTVQERTIFQRVSKLNMREAAPAGFKASLGETVPASLKLHALPYSVTTHVPAVRRYDYAMLRNNEVLIVNPRNKTVADIITQG